ncbi:unnamed protein product [Durusdinium trenchii]|uniref:RING-type domain-containing protein n=1 Tax=Durusdinium trenchii TaxID=1381693 RepID=A0ABP0MRC4_9DINO
MISVWALACLWIQLAGFHFWADAQAVVCRVKVLSDLEGEIVGRVGSDGTSREGCAWHIYPGLSLRAIEFHLLEPAHFEGSDRLIVYGSGNMHPATRVATFHRGNPIPPGMMMTGTSEAMLVLNGQNNESFIRLGYSCRPIGTRIGDMWFSPVGYACVLAAFIVVGFAISLMPVYLVCYCKARRAQDLVMQESQLMMRSELASRFRQNEAVRAQERQVVASLEALPIQKWKDEEGRRRSTNECCLCLEAYGDEDMLRVLPCGHYFHQACIDKWFFANRFIPRSCPLCKRDPVLMILSRADAPAGQDEEAVPAERPSSSAVATVLLKESL